MTLPEHLTEEINFLEYLLEDCDPGQTRMEMRDRLVELKRLLEEETIKIQ